MKTTELDQIRNERFLFFRMFNRESILIIMVAVCVIIATGNHFRMNAVIDANADIRSGYEVNIRNMIDSNSEKVKEIRLLQNKVDRLEADLHAGDN